MLSKLLLTTLSTVISFLLAAEIFGRLSKHHGITDVHWEPGYFRHDLHLGWRGIPELRRLTSITRSLVAINAYGFRDTDPLECKKGSNEDLCVLFIGDSQMFGWELRKEHRISEQFGQLAAKSGRIVRTYNAGIPGFGSGQALLALKEVYPQLAPDIAVLLVGYNDFTDDSQPFVVFGGSRVYRPFFDTDGRLLINDPVPQRPSLAAQQYRLPSAGLWLTLDRVRYLLDDLIFFRHLPLPQFLTGLNEIALVTSEKWQKEFFELAPRNLALIGEMNAFVRSRGGKFIVLFPLRSSTGSLTQQVEWFASKLYDMNVETVCLADSLVPKQIRDDLFLTNIDCNERRKNVNLSSTVSFVFPRSSSSVIYDSHGNYNWNYLMARELMERVFPESPPPRGKPLWESDLPSNLRVANKEANYFLFGNWHRNAMEGTNKDYRAFDEVAGAWIKTSNGKHMWITGYASKRLQLQVSVHPYGSVERFLGTTGFLVQGGPFEVSLPLKCPSDLEICGIGLVVLRNADPVDRSSVAISRISVSPSQSEIQQTRFSDFDS